MDLIYMNADKEDVGVLLDYNFDLAFGLDENDFECRIIRSNHCCETGYYLYYEGTEYGGIIDSIKVDTDKDEIIYSGRTWHGILDKKVICPDDAQDYLILDGEANSVLGLLIDRIGLSGLFEASTKDSGIIVSSYKMDRYITGYKGIRKMLKEFNGKLKFNFVDGKCILSATPFIDYSKTEEFDDSQVSFSVERNYRPTNHLICLGKGDLKDRRVIHLFTDANGGIQPYTTAENPVQDSEYILDKSKQVLFDSDEVTEVYDYSNAEIRENYVPLQAKPDNWKSVCETFYRMNENGKYTLLEKTTEDVYSLLIQKPYDWETNSSKYYRKNGSSYTNVEPAVAYVLQTEKPSDWNTKCNSYFKKSGNSYVAVEKVAMEEYVILSEKPSAWEQNYSNYYSYYSDGVKEEYRRVSGESKVKYNPHTMKPSDWETNWEKYYERDYKGSFVRLPGEKRPEWMPKWFYTQETYMVAPAWDSIYYSKVSRSLAPAWASGTYYTKVESAAPTWVSGTYYSMTNETIIPDFIPGAIFEKVFDGYAELVSGGIEKIKKSYDCDKVSIGFDTDGVFDIGDIVGASERITGISVWQQITKKIVTIKNNTTTIKYEVGE